MAKALVVMVVNEHDLSALFQCAPPGSCYCEVALQRREWTLPTPVILDQFCHPMVTRLRQQQEWPRG